MSQRLTARPSSGATWPERFDVRERHSAAAGAPSSSHRTAGTEAAGRSKRQDGDPVHASRARRGVGDWQFIVVGSFVPVQAELTGRSWPVRHGMSRCDAARNSWAAACRVRACGSTAALDPGRG